MIFNFFFQSALIVHKIAAEFCILNLYSEIPLNWFTSSGSFERIFRPCCLQADIWALCMLKLKCNYSKPISSDSEKNMSLTPAYRHIYKYFHMEPYASTLSKTWIHTNIPVFNSLPQELSSLSPIAYLQFPI